MITVDIPGDLLKKLEGVLKGTDKQLRREIHLAVNATTKRAQRIIGKEIATELAAPIKEIVKTITTIKKPTQIDPSGTVRLKKTNRLPLNVFRPNQTALGVTFKVSKTKGRKFRAHAFMGPKPGVRKISWRNNVFMREGKARLPINKQTGVSPWGVFVKRHMEKTVKRYIQLQLATQMAKRIRFKVLKSQGKLNWQRQG